MELNTSKVFLWILYYYLATVQCDQSLSFSLPINESTFPTSTFWHGTIASTLFEHDLRIQVHLNEMQGLLFYGIDNLYQSIWIQIESTQFIINYYNFKIDAIDQTKLDATKLCNQRILTNTILNLTLSLTDNNLIISCNRHKEKIYYSPSLQLIKDASTKKFIEEMKFPVPSFDISNNTNQTKVWIGNIPSTNMDDFRNTKLVAQPKNLLGCIMSFMTGNREVNLTDTGLVSGNMIERFCNPICGEKQCSNDVICTELWRQRFQCQCGFSGYRGQFCNTSYGVDFNGQQTVDVSIEIKLQNFQVVFKQVNSQVSSTLLSIKFIFNQNLFLYIDQKRHLQMKFTTENDQKIDLSFESTIDYNVTYILIIDADINAMNFKLVNSQNRQIIEKKTISKNLPNLVVVNITVGGSHSETMKWMERFHGCISNLMLKTGKREFLWNRITNFDKLPTCDKKRSTALNGNPSLEQNQYIISTLSDVSGTTDGSGDISALKIVGIVIPIICLIGVAAVLLYKFRSKLTKKKSDNKKFVKVKTRGATPESMPIKFKEPFKARGDSQQSKDQMT